MKGKTQEKLKTKKRHTRAWIQKIKKQFLRLNIKVKSKVVKNGQLYPGPQWVKDLYSQHLRP